MESGAAEAPAGGADAPARGGAENDPRPEPRRVIGIIAAVVVLVSADQATKAWAVAALSDGPISIVGDTVELHLSRNPGGAFSVFSAFRGVTPVLALMAAIVSVFLWRAAHRATDRWMLAGMVLVLGGALGNLVDRVARSPGFLRGHVVDFVSVGWWPVFNLADSAISVGAVLLLLRGWFAAEEPRDDPSPAGIRG